MKKILFSGAAAILAVVGASSFKQAHKGAVKPYTLISGPTVQVGFAIPTNVQFVQAGDASTCSGGSNYCVVSINTDHITNAGAGSHLTQAQLPLYTVSTKG